MLRQDRRQAAQRYTGVDRDVEALVANLRRLALHRGYDRQQLASPLLKRLLHRPIGATAIEAPELHRRVTAEELDRNAITYLVQTVEAELDLARLRLT